MRHITIGIVLLGGGILLLMYSNGLVNFFGISDRAEKRLGSTRNLYVLLGLFIMLIGCLFLFGVIETKDMNNVMEVKRGI